MTLEVFAENVEIKVGEFISYGPFIYYESTFSDIFDPLPL